MDLSFARSHPQPVALLPIELAVLLVGVASRQAASPTARTQTMLAVADANHALLRPDGGCFSAATAAALTTWKL